MVGIRFFANVLLFLTIYLKRAIVFAEEPICCFPRQYESFMYALDTHEGGPGGGGAYVALPLTNGTMKVAYDAIYKRTYRLTKYSQPDVDPPVSDVNVTMILDHKNHVFYQVILDIYCQQGTVDGDIILECIPKNATLMGEGRLGDSDTIVQTYLVTLKTQEDVYQIIASIIHTDKTKGECMPVRLSLTDYPHNTNTDVIITDIYDVTKGIQDSSIFDKPPSCNNSEIHGRLRSEGWGFL